MGSSMENKGKALIRPCLLLLFGLQAGCAGLFPGQPVPHFACIPQAARPAGATPEIQTASYQEPVSSLTVAGQTTATVSQQPAGPPFADMSEFSVEALVQQVLARNPSLAQMVAAWQAASARYPQVTSLEDPMFGATMAPASIGSKNVDFAGRLEISQKLPYPGKLKLRGDKALAETSAAGLDVDDMRLQLTESARNAFYEHYLVGRALAVNRETRQRLDEFRADAEALYKTPPRDRKVSLQDVVQARVEIGRQEERQLTLERMREVAVARINTLMHLPTNSPLPPPPKQLQLAGPMPDVQVLQATALGRRPDLQARADRLAAEQASLNLAEKEFYPDFEVMAAYDAFWQPPQQPLQGQIGLRLNLPVRKSRRYGAVAEAEARLAQLRAELDRQIDLVNFQVQDAYAQVHESEHIVRLYEKKVLPDAELNVKTARADYMTGQIPAISVIEAERNRLNLYDRYYEAVADYFRRRATLERVVGGSLVTSLPVPGAGSSSQP
jgi:cobalt-zinc-cadmium efflux system outer membrane protein